MRRYVLLSLLLSAACARTPSRETPVEDPSDRVSDTFLTAFIQRRFSDAVAMYNAPLKAAAAPEKQLEDAWNYLTPQQQPCTQGRIVDRVRRDNFDLRITELQCGANLFRARVAVDPSTGAVAGLYFNKVPQALGSPPYADKAAFGSEEVKVGTAPFLLSGLLTIPTSPGLHPAVVLVHGSGPNDRDESVGGNKIFRDLAEGLSSRGVVVLRYQKRTNEYRGRMGDTITLEQEVIDDAVAGVALLRARPEVDSGLVFVIGHSLGASLAPEIAGKSGAAGAVLLAPPGRNPFDIILDQHRYLGAPAETIASLEEQISRIRKGEISEGDLLGTPVAYWKDWASRDGIATARTLKKPLLILHGARDYQVNEEDAKLWRAGMAGVPNVTLETLSGDNHLFLTGTGKPGPAEYEVPGHMDARVVEITLAFLKAAGAAYIQDREPSEMIDRVMLERGFRYLANPRVYVTDLAYKRPPWPGTEGVGDVGAKVLRFRHS